MQNFIGKTGKQRVTSVVTRWISTVLSAVFLGMTVLCAAMVPKSTALAAEVEEAEENVESEEELAYKLPVDSNKWKGWTKGPKTHGEAAIVMEVGTGTILYAKDIDSKQYPASITKVLTALVALENSEMSDKVTFFHDCVAFMQPGDSSVGLKEGNVITMEQALYAMLLASANEAAYAVGENTGKNAGYDYDWFIQKMNERVTELGGVNSNFTNTNGLHDKKHYTCARDMALIGRELFKHPEFFEIVQTSQYTIPKTKKVEEHVFQQKDKMLQPASSEYYEPAVGGKTGYTSDAMSTLITMADNDEMQLVCVVLRTYGRNIYPDTRSLLDYGFDNFKKVDVSDLVLAEEVEEVLGSDSEEVVSAVSEPESVESESAAGNANVSVADYVVVPKKAKISKISTEITPDGVGSDEATLTATYQGQNVGTCRVRLTESYLKEHDLLAKDTADDNESGTDENAQKSKEPGWLKQLKKFDKFGILEKTGIDQRLMEMSKTELLVLAAEVVLLVILIFSLIITMIVIKIKIKRIRRQKHKNRKK